MWSRRVFRAVQRQHLCRFAVSSRTIVYKGMFLVGQLAQLLSATCRTRITEVRHCYGTLPLLHQHQRRPGSAHIRTASSCTTAKSTRSAATPTACSPARRRCRIRCHERGGSGQGLSGCQSRQAPTPPCLDNTLEFLVMNGMELPMAVMILHSGAVVEQQEHARARSWTSTTTTQP